MSSSTLTIATTNPGKARELGDLLQPHFNEIRHLADHPETSEVPETGDTFRANALEKARGYFNQLEEPILAEDSGLCVDALDGVPGVKSARYAGDQATDEENNQKLLDELSDVPPEQRTARFECHMILFIQPDLILETSGQCPGTIVTDPRGEGGFGYDPLFQPEDAARTFGEMTTEEKKNYSHRGRAGESLTTLLSRADDDLGIGLNTNSVSNPSTKDV